MQGTPPPPALSSVGPLNVRGSLEGSHLAPVARAQWLAPSSGVQGNATFSPTRMAGDLSGPAFSLRAVADITSPNAERARNADTQAEATYWGAPRVEGVEVDGALAGVDVTQLAAPAPPAPPAPGAQEDGDGAAVAGGDAAGGGALAVVQHQMQQQLAARGSGGGSPATLMLPPGRSEALQQQLSAAASSGGSGSAGGGVVLPSGGPGGFKLRLSGRLRLSAKRDESEARRRQQLGAAGDTGAASSPYLFTGPLTLEGLRVNQLSLARFLAGDVALTEPRLLMRARGGRADELLELDLALPTPHQAGGPGPDGRIPAPLYWPEGFGPSARSAVGAGGPAARRDVRRAGAGVAEPAAWEDRSLEAAAARGRGLGPLGARDAYGAGGSSGGPGAGGGGGQGGRDDEEAEQRVSHVLLRRGGLYLSSTVSRGERP